MTPRWASSAIAYAALHGVDATYTDGRVVLVLPYSDDTGGGVDTESCSTMADVLAALGY